MFFNIFKDWYHINRSLCINYHDPHHLPLIIFIIFIMFIIMAIIIIILFIIFIIIRISFYLAAEPLWVTLHPIV